MEGQEMAHVHDVPFLRHSYEGCNVACMACILRNRASLLGKATDDGINPLFWPDGGEAAVSPARHLVSLGLFGRLPDRRGRFSVLCYGT